MPFITSFERWGIRKGPHKGIEACLKIKFRDEGLKLMPEIREIRDHELLEKILQAIDSATSPQDLRPIWHGKNNSEK